MLVLLSYLEQDKSMPHCDLRLRWKVASDLRFRAAISEPKTPSFCGISGDLAQSTRKSLAIAIVRFWCAKLLNDFQLWQPRGGVVFAVFVVFVLSVIFLKGDPDASHSLTIGSEMSDMAQMSTSQGPRK